ncbi:adenylyltransferase/cytidyltransferase family protein [Fictibacillus sp. KIGAM418]|uniref:Adenylyltransferase/cytidyltransferase family protein n=1 Tax=Fictibacillus marinisediminis TaxID=2878389 RepID=A0A9X1XES8_9BACL|nr:adenylyltransferase/cytidyltransferase family protein [Fictibacillus marinisediminis]MCK6259474.1 adenylyltransferase/cytidyltransferase family protein [Fictibacillus marinisediminis]
MRSKRLQEKNLLQYVNHYKRSDKTIILAGGCFDLFHPGHLEYLHGAKDLGDILIVGINSDDSIQSIKGKRPLFPLKERVAFLSSLECVDHLLVIPDLTLVRAIQIIKPHFFVKGIDYQGKTFPEQQAAKDVGADIKLIGEKKLYSSTQLKKIYER